MGVVPVLAYADALHWLYGFPEHRPAPLSVVPRDRLTLRPLRALLTRLDDPQRGRGTIHITGSKGKGSTAAMVEAMLRAGGQRTGLFTSPHLHSETERIQIDGAPISRARFAAYVEQIQPHVTQVLADVGPLTPFELRTALAFLAYREAGVQWQVVEVGIGGRLDSTNVLDEKHVSIFTPISLEHTAILGTTVAEITGDKAGILRAGCVAVMSPQRESAAGVLRARCADLGVPLHEVAKECALSVDSATPDGQTVRLRTPRQTYRIALPLLGQHQVENAATAVLSVEQLPAAGVTVDAAAVRQGLASVRWPGRMEVLKRSPTLLVDGAHTPDSAKRLGQGIRSTFSPRRVVAVVGLSADKDVEGFARALTGELGEISVIATRAMVSRSADVDRVAQAFAACESPVRSAPDVNHAVQDALAEATASDMVVVTGSLFVVAEARAWLLGILPDEAHESIPTATPSEENA